MTETAHSRQATVERWYLDHRKSIFAVCYAYLRDRDEADELVQETFLRAFRKIHAFRGESPPVHWLKKIAVRLCIDRVRSRKWKARAKMRPLQEVRDLPSQEDRRKATDARIMMDGVLDSLSPRQRMVVALRFYEGLAIPEISQVMGCHPGTVKRHLYRALDRLKCMTGGKE